MKHAPGFVVGGLIGFGVAWLLNNKAIALPARSGKTTRPSFI
jgi:hypothetical protein